MRQYVKQIFISAVTFGVLATGIMIWRQSPRPCADSTTEEKRQYETWKAEKERFKSASEEEIEALLEKANNGDIRARQQLAYRYLEGIGVPKNDEKAYGMYVKLAESGDTVAMYLLGNLHCWGRGSITVDYQKAFDWYDKALSNGSCKAAIFISGLYRRGREGFPADQQKAAEYELLAEQMGVDNVGDLYFLGKSFTNGKLSRDGRKAMMYYEAAASKGHTSAMLELAVAHYDGIFVDVDLEEARKWIDDVCADRGASAINFIDRIVSAEKAAEIKQWYHQVK